MNFDAETLYSLLPAIYRIRDAEQGETLKALIGIIAEQALVVEEGLLQQYDDQFIETCADWVIPYIGDLIGYRPLSGKIPKISSPRPEVANTVPYRRRKGTASILEQLAKDVTGWDARVVEYFQHLALNQSMELIRPDNRGTVDVRDWQALEWLKTSFETTKYSLEVRQITTRRGRYNIQNLGIFLWRLRSYSIIRGTARQIGNNGYTFNPLGIDTPLFNQPQSENDISQLAQPINVPEPLNRRLLYEELESLRKLRVNALQNNKITQDSHYFGDKPVFQVFVNNNEIPPERIFICNLSNWRRPPADPNPTVEMPIRVAVDPLLNRITLSENENSALVEVSYGYGFSDDLGGGTYERTQAYLNILNPQVEPLENNDENNFVQVSDAISLTEALENNDENHLVIELENSITIVGDFTITLSVNQTLQIQAQNGQRPVIDGRITVESATDAVLIIDGLLITQGIQVNGSDSMTLSLSHCTLAPWIPTNETQEPQLPNLPSIQWADQASIGNLFCDRTISGRFILAQGITLNLTNSIIDALGDETIALAGSDSEETALIATGKVEKIAKTTIIGQCYLTAISLIENSIIMGNVIVEKKQQGCVRFSYLPLTSQVPRRYRCQPQTELDILRVRPQFTSLKYGQPNYAQLSQRCPLEIRQGAEDECEMGVFHDLYQYQRETNLRVRLEEYLRFGLEAGIFYVT